MTDHNENAPPRRLLDAAVLLTVSSILLYVLGWVYWATLLGHFGLSVDIVGLSFEQVISTTWPIVIVFVIWIPVILIKGAKEGRSGAISAGIAAVIVLLAALILLVGRKAGLSVGQEVLWFCVVLLIGFALDFFLVPVEGQSFKPTHLAGLGMGALAFLLAVYWFIGIGTALNLAQGVGATCITVQTTTDPQPAPNLLILARSSGMIFLAPHNASGKKTRAIMLPENVIRAATVEECVP